MYVNYCNTSMKCIFTVSFQLMTFAGTVTKPPKGRVQNIFFLNMVFDHNWGGGGHPKPYPYCKTPLFLKILYTSSIILNL